MTPAEWEAGRCADCETARGSAPGCNGCPYLGPWLATLADVARRPMDAETDDGRCNRCPKPATTAVMTRRYGVEL